MERTKPEHPGVLALGVDMPMSPPVADTLRTLLAADGVVRFGPGTPHPLPADTAERFGFKSLLSMALHPRTGQPWQFGIHQCARARTWTAEEERLFQEVGRRLADALTTLLAHRDLRESEQRFYLVFENSPVSIWEEDFSGVKSLLDSLKAQGVSDIESYFAQHPETVRRCAGLAKIIDVNRAALALHGAATKDELLAGLVNTFTPESFDAFRQELVCLWNGGTELSQDTVVKTLGGELRHVTVYFSVCPGHETTLARVLVSLADITERKRVEEALVFVAQRGWQTGAENFFAALAQFLGEKLDMDYALIDRIGENPELAETVALYAKGALAPNLRYALKGTPCENVMGRRLCVYREGIQQLFPEDPLLPQMGAESYIGIPLWDSAGQPIGLIAVMSRKPLPDAAPVTQLLQLVATRAAAELERERSDRWLRTREHEFRTLAENLPDNIVRYNREGRTIYVNPALEKTLGANAARMLGTTIRELHPDGSYETYAQAVDAALTRGANGEIEITVPVPGREPLIHQIRTIVERDAPGQVSGVLAIGRDITERKRAEAELRQLNQELDQRVKDRTAELEVKNKELERMNRLFVGRELRMVELKQRIRDLEQQGRGSEPAGET
jgi:PAS domain S-box-containing protein